MKRATAAVLAASLLTAIPPPAACATHRAAGPFETVPTEPSARPPHRLAYAVLLTGGGLVGLSFTLTDRANRTYADYLRATDPDAVEGLYDRTVRYDRFAAAALLTGEALIVTGVWLRFLHRPGGSRLVLTADAGRCAVSLRF